MMTGRRLAPALLLVAACVRAEGGRFIPVFDADLRGGFTKLNRGPIAGGAIGTVLALPAYKVSDSGMILPIYTFDGSVYDKTVEVAETDAVLFVSRQVHSGSLGFKQGLGSAFDGKISFDGAYALNRETPSEKVGKGLYDYFDLGGRAVMTWKAEQDGRPAPVNGSVKVYQRTYPNFSSLASKNKELLEKRNPAAAAELGDKEKHPKDYLGVEAGASLPLYLGGWKLRTAYTAAYKAYSDSFLRTNQGAITSTKRADFLHRLELGGAAGAPSGWTYGADLDGRFNASNSTWYDVSQPVRPYITHFNQFVSGRLAPWSAWALPFGAELHPKVRVTGISMARWYTHRFKQNNRGEYQGAKQFELEYGLDVRGWYPFAKWISATLGVTGYLDRSNNYNVQFTRYNYELLVLSGGATVSF